MVNKTSYIKEARSLFALGLPLIGSQVAQFAVHTTDVLMLGHYSVISLAQVTLAGQVFFIAFILGSGFAWAILPMVAKAAAEDDVTQIRRVTRMGLWLSTLMGAVLLVFMWFAKPILISLGQDPVVAAGAQDYLRIAGVGLLPALWVMVLRSYLSAVEHTGIVFWVSIFVLVTNAAVNYALIFGNFGMPEMGLQGAAIASLSVHALSLIGFILYIQYHFAAQAMFARLWRADWAAIREVSVLAWPISVTALAESGLFAASAFMMGALGVLELAAHGIVLQLAALSFMVHLGLSQAATVRVGQAWARRSADEIQRTGNACFMLSFSISVFIILLFIFTPELLISAFVDWSDPNAQAVLQLGITLLFMAAVFQFVDGAQVVGLSVLRGMQDTQRPMWIAAISYWGIGMPVGYVLGFMTNLREIGIWAGLVTGLTAAAILLWLRYRVMLGNLRSGG